MALRNTVRLHDPRGNRLGAGPAVEPVTLTELKTHLRIVGTDEDTYLTQLIIDARQELEDTTGLAFITQNWILTLDRWPRSNERWWDGVRQGAIGDIYGDVQPVSLELPRYPLISVDVVTVYDEDSNDTVVTIANTFDVDVSFLRGRLTLQRGATWPVALRANDAIVINYTSGYGASAANVPAPLKRAIRNMAAYMYEHRGDCNGEDAYLTSGAKDIMDRYRAVDL